MKMALYLLEVIAKNLSPWFFYATGLSLFVLFLVGTSPLQETPESGLWDVIAIRIRKIVLSVLATLFIFLPLFVALLSVLVSGSKWYEIFTSFLYDIGPKLKHFWSAPIAGLATGLFLRLFWKRYYLPLRSKFWRYFRTKQTGDSLSDIRTEKARLNSKKFEPIKFYKKGFIFYGLDSENKPLYVSTKDWKTQNQKIIGPTQTGKGVHIGCQLDQSIWNNCCTVFVDPKGDLHAVHIMNQACTDTGRTLCYLDFNSEKPALFWNPFKNGVKRERRTRLHYAYGLRDTGLDSDFYKAGERELIDKVWPQWDGTISSLKSILEKKADSAKRTLSYLGEWLHIPAFNGGATEFNIDDFIRSGGVLYVKSSLQDETVIKGTTVFLMDLMQSIIRLYEEKQRENHVFVVVDEVKFLISDMLSESLATICGFDSHIAIAYQSILDIRNLKDKSVNPLAIEQSVNVNCKQTLCYMAPDTETAEWASDQTGEVQKTVTRMEGVEINELGGETWEKRRLLNREAENLIPPNVFRMLPERTGVFFRPAELAKILYTGWVPVVKKYCPQIATGQHENPNQVKAEAQASTFAPQESTNGTKSFDDIEVD